MRIYQFFYLLLFAIAACTTNQNSIESDFLAANIDTSVNPGDDFFEYAEGAWLKKTEIPAAESSWGIGNLVQEEIYIRLKKINEDAVSQQGATGVDQQIGDFWYSGMDTVSIEKSGLQSIRPLLDRIDKVNTVNDILDVTSDFHVRGIETLFEPFIDQDSKNSSRYAFFLYQGGLGMPNRDYYFNSDTRTSAIRQAYKVWLATTFKQLGNDSSTARQNADAVFDLERRLAMASRKLADLRDPYLNYNKVTVSGLASISPEIAWSNYFKSVHITKIDSVIVGQPEFFTVLNKELRSTAINDWRNYLKARLIYSSAPYLDSKTYGNYFNYRKNITGASEPRPRWKRVLDAEEDALGEALGQIFVKEYFNETAKKRYSDLVENIRSAYKERIAKLTWMSSETKKRAFEKLASIEKKVGFPEKWKDFSALKINRGAFVNNVFKSNEWWHNYEISKLDKPVDKNEWRMTPQTWNAYYNPGNNEIVLPAGIFAVPGKKDEELDDAFVYGYAGASTIGHEITHGFDDQGRQYDSKGNLFDWWQPSDAKQFKDRAKFIVRQFNEYVPVDTLHINGEATQGENIADLGGVLLGLDAFKKTDTYKKGEKIGGFTPLQRYFLGYAYSWMFKTRKERLANLVMTDVHSPAKQRVNGALVNVPEFYGAFNIRPNDKMFLPINKRVQIW